MSNTINEWLRNTNPEILDRLALLGLWKANAIFNWLVDDQARRLAAGEPASQIPLHWRAMAMLMELRVSAAGCITGGPGEPERLLPGPDMLLGRLSVFGRGTARQIYLEIRSAHECVAEGGAPVSQIPLHWRALAEVVGLEVNGEGRIVGGPANLPLGLRLPAAALAVRVVDTEG